MAPIPQVGPYEILAPIGEGGMGTVYKARDTRLDRIVALKVSKDPYDTRFRRESRALAALNHPNICTIYDVGSNYLVMEYIEGRPLKGPAAVEEVLPFALQICSALQAAHEKGITHRDLKPANILLTKSGIKLLDFGLANVKVRSEREETTAQTHDGAILGTPYYMSPEQAQGKPVDARSDIFSFGSLLYELLTGRKAFQGPNTVATLMSIIHDEPAPLESAPEMQRVIERCLRKRPVDRYQSTADLRVALEEVSLRVPPLAATLDSLNWNPGQATAMSTECMTTEPATFEHSIKGSLSERLLSPIRVSGALAFLVIAGVVGWWYTAREMGSREPAMHQITATL